ncbi:hypothetical protein [Fischerella sp. PCC 9605]|uniref:hypothetical protein n=1 Tax=Fischerella sp. PCC 9605 TaxID=1173024 RepID=UPI0018CC1BA8|nr:hypothetical protein [Fischerella sp. PCC 9605]
MLLQNGVAESRYELSFCRRLVRLLYEKGCALRCRVRNFVERRILTDASFRCATLSMTKSNSYFKSATPAELIRQLLTETEAALEQLKKNYQQLPMLRSLEYKLDWIPPF